MGSLCNLPSSIRYKTLHLRCPYDSGRHLVLRNIQKRRQEHLTLPSVAAVKCSNKWIDLAFETCSPLPKLVPHRATFAVLQGQHALIDVGHQITLKVGTEASVQRTRWALSPAPREGRAETRVCSGQKAKIGQRAECRRLCRPL